MVTLLFLFYSFRWYSYELVVNLKLCCVRKKRGRMESNWIIKELRAITKLYVAHFGS